MPAIRFVKPDVNHPRLVQRDVGAEKELAILKELIWYYLIRSPGLASQQAGHQAIVRNLYAAYKNAGADPGHALIPRGFRELLDIGTIAAENQAEVDLVQARIACDLVCSMTESQAIAINQRLTGQASGSVLDAVLR